MVRKTFLIGILAAGCTFFSCKEDESPAPTHATVTGLVKDQNGNVYSNTAVSLIHSSETKETRTGPMGRYKFTTQNTGNHGVTFTPPLATKVVSEVPVMIDIQDYQEYVDDFTIEPQPLNPHVVIGSVDIFGELRKKDGSVPVQATDTLFARNVFDNPIGKLTPIKAPDGHPLVLSEWEAATGTVIVTCNGNTSTVNISLTGMIPNGTYTIWLNFLNKTKKVGEFVHFGADVVKIEPLGSGTQNIVIAGGNGTINATLTHSACILTEETALVMPIIYHINGNTFGSAHIPDEEEVNHMLVYFQ